MYVIGRPHPQIPSYLAICVCVCVCVYIHINICPLYPLVTSDFRQDKNEDFA